MPTFKSSPQNTIMCQVHCILVINGNTTIIINLRTAPLNKYSTRGITAQHSDMPYLVTSNTEAGGKTISMTSFSIIPAFLYRDNSNHALVVLSLAKLSSCLPLLQIHQQAMVV